MPNPRQLALQIQINERASLKNFFVSKNNNKTIQILKNILLNSNNGVQIFIDDLGSNGKSYLLQAICNDFSNSSNSSIYIPMQEAINLDPSILEGVSELNLICIDDIDLISKRREWEIAPDNLRHRRCASGKSHCPGPVSRSPGGSGNPLGGPRLPVI